MGCLLPKRREVTPMPANSIPAVTFWTILTNTAYPNHTLPMLQVTEQVLRYPSKKHRWSHAILAHAHSPSLLHSLCYDKHSFGIFPQKSLLKWQRNSLFSWSCTPKHQQGESGPCPLLPIKSICKEEEWPKLTLLRQQGGWGIGSSSDLLQNAGCWNAHVLESKGPACHLCTVWHTYTYEIKSISLLASRK